PAGTLPAGGCCLVWSGGEIDVDIAVLCIKYQTMDAVPNLSAQVGVAIAGCRCNGIAALAARNHASDIAIFSRTFTLDYSRLVKLDVAISAYHFGGLALDLPQLYTAAHGFYLDAVVHFVRQGNGDGISIKGTHVAAEDTEGPDLGIFPVFFWLNSIHIHRQHTICHRAVVTECTPGICGGFHRDAVGLPRLDDHVGVFRIHHH